MKIFIYSFLILFCANVYPQTMPAVSQFDKDQVHINPATVGNKEALVVAFKFRKHWTGIEGSPSTQIFTAHAPMRNPKVALGILLENENIGITNYTGIYLNYAYRVHHKVVFHFAMMHQILPLVQKPTALWYLIAVLAYTIIQINSGQDFLSPNFLGSKVKPQVLIKW
jgi:type IX secretion system PorP/SprF family membrane protein